MRRATRQTWLRVGVRTGVADVRATQVDDARFTDEEILTVVRAGESGMKLTDLCQATGITVNTYYEWKARYGGLTPQAIAQQRLRAHTRQRRLAMLACAVGVAAVGVGGLMITRQSDAASFVPPVIPHPPARGRCNTDCRTRTPSASGAVAERHGDIRAGGVCGDTRRRCERRWPDVIAERAYSVQVAAVPDLQLARVALEKLVAAGYPAHMTTKTVNRVEMYRVRVGPLQTRDAADRTAARLARDGYASPWVTR